MAKQDPHPQQMPGELPTGITHTAPSIHVLCAGPEALNELRKLCTDETARRLFINQLAGIAAVGLINGDVVPAECAVHIVDALGKSQQVYEQHTTSRPEGWPQ